MIKKAPSSKIPSKILYSALFFISGIVGGLLGSGGGVIAVLALNRLIKDKQKKKIVFATSMAIILPMSAISSVIYSKEPFMDIYSLSHYIIPGCAGGIVGALLFNKMNFKLLNIIFSLLVIFSGFCMIL